MGSLINSIIRRAEKDERKRNGMKKYDVNIDLANEAKVEMAKSINVNDDRVLNKLGAFSSLYDIRFEEYKHPVMVLKTEEPGSKQLIAAKYDRIESVCYDMINHLINDCIVMGAKPLTVQDAIICGKLDKDIVTRIVKAISEACSRQECILTGGETSEQPGVLNEDTYILTSSIVGIVEKDQIIDGSGIEEGHVVLALESSGIHTNGYTLVRRIMNENPEILDEKIEGAGFIDAILEPHRCYYKALKGLFGKDMITGLAHITGGGIKENLNRILPSHLSAAIDLSLYEIPAVFSVLKKYGNINDEEMLRTFNLGVGIALVAPERAESDIRRHLDENGIKSYRIGKIVQGDKSVICEGSLQFH